MDRLKKEWTGYWNERAEKFSALHLKEFQSEKKELWWNEIKKYLPEDKNLKILDVGCGSGFFTFLLTEQGYDVKGIDLTESMIKNANKQAEDLEIKAEFFVMDGESPDFPEGDFDVIVSRNFTWQLPSLNKVYSNWYSLLKTDGILINFDGDYTNEEEEKKVKGSPVHQDIESALFNKYEELLSEVAVDGYVPRPPVDEKILKETGFKNIVIDKSVSERVYKTVDEFYNPTPLFCISGIK